MNKYEKLQKQLKEEKDLMKRVFYESYKAQRDHWFNPSTCSERVLKIMKDCYGNIDELEEQYQRNLGKKDE